MIGALAANSAKAHGPQIQLTATAGKIETRRLIANEPYDTTLQPLTSIYVLPAVNISNVWQIRPNALNSLAGGAADISGPGLAPGYGFTDADSHPFKTGNYTITFIDGLKKWDSGISDFTDPGATQLQAYKSVANSTTTMDAGGNSITWNINVTSSNAHSGMSYKFLGDGASDTSGLNAGVYLASMKVSHGTLTDSDPYYFLIYQGVSASTVSQAANSLASSKGISAAAIQFIVPEPASATLGVIGLATLVRRRRSTRHAIAKG
jgi:hypothetical protein